MPSHNTAILQEVLESGRWPFGGAKAAKPGAPPLVFPPVRGDGGRISKGGESLVAQYIQDYSLTPTESEILHELCRNLDEIDDLKEVLRKAAAPRGWRLASDRRMTQKAPAAD
jgi:hypothetical protein